MQKTTVLYVTAVATLAGAFLLAPHKQAPAPEPVVEPVPPVPAGPASITHLTYDDGRVSVDARLSRGLFSTLHSAPLFMDAAVSARDLGEVADLALVLVIDRSGSMAGAKIDDAKLAAQGMIKRLKPSDHVAIVSYGTDVTVDLPLSAASAGLKGRAMRAIESLEEGGGTNIDGALRATHGLVSRAALEHRAVRVLLVSDGRPTEGARSQNALARHATKLHASGAVISTIGVGLDYNEDLMEHLAKTGTGRYHYLKRSRQLTKILGDELQHATRAAARNVIVRLPKAFDGFRVTHVQGAPVNNTGRDVELALGDLAAGETRHVLFQLERQLERAADMPAAVAISAPRIAYTTVRDPAAQELSHLANAFRIHHTDDVDAIRASERPEVFSQTLRFEASRALRSAADAYAQGDVVGAERIANDTARQLRKVAERTQDPDTLRSAKKLDDAATQMRASRPATSSGRDLIKAQKADAYWLSY